ncbi:MAG TPA: hypothetical protein VMU64_05435 [Acidimicrobiales bacterium]|nr:hypothetical protein [Acidimicrobiales bacterium]
MQLAPVTRRPYQHTGQGHDRRLRPRRGAQARANLWRIEVTIGAVVLVLVTMALTTWPVAAPTRLMPPGLTLTHSGLVIADPFKTATPNRQLLDHYVFNGSAAPGVGFINASNRGLDVGVRAHSSWSGWFAVTLRAAGPDVVWHAVMSRPSTPVGSGVGEAVLAVQSASTQRNGTINYVVVATYSSQGKSTWQIGSAHGVVADAVTDRLWQEPLRADAPSSEPVTIRTDGHHTLTVWFGDRQVYSNHHLHMNDPAPFQAYLEVQGRKIPYVSNFKDFWVTDAAPVIVKGTAPGSHLTLDTGHGVVHATSDSGGLASLNVPVPELVGTGTLTVSDRSGVRQFRHLHYAGGDEVQITPR